MPRFAITKYTPAKDSTPACREVDPTRVVLTWQTRDPLPNPGEPQMGCPCGCGEQPAGRRAIFKMGHDARLRGKLIRAHLTATEVVYVIDGKTQPPQTPAQVANLYNWVPYLEDAQLRWNHEVRSIEDRVLGSRRRIKVGRWEYSGTVLAVEDDRYVIEYQTLNGKAAVARVPPADAPLAEESV